MSAAVETRLRHLDDAEIVRTVREAYANFRSVIECSRIEVADPQIGWAFQGLLDHMADLDADYLSGGAESLVERAREESR